MKQTTLCLGAGCFMEANFETKNCAVAFVNADAEDPLSLGVGEPGCAESVHCENGLPLPCEPECEGDDCEGYTGSADVTIDW